MTGALRTGVSIALEGSPLAALAARVGAQLADGAIACACPHPATADRLCLPSGLLGCDECVRSVQATVDGAWAPACSWCGAVATMTTAWLAGAVLVLARVCQDCGTAGNAAMSPN